MRLATAHSTANEVSVVAPFVPLLYGAQVQIIHQLDTEIVTNRLWFSFDTGPFTLSDLQGCSDGVASWWVDMVLPFLSADLVTATVLADDWTADPPPNSAATTVNQFGGVAAESSTANVAIVVPFRWPRGIRLKKNKHYVAGVPEQEITLNTPSADIRNALFEAYAALIDRARLFSPILHWRWVGASAWVNNNLRSEQLYYEIQGPQLDGLFKLGQRRRRLPP